MNAAHADSVKQKQAKPLRLAALLVLFAVVIVGVTTLLELALVHHFGIEHASQEAQLKLEQLSWQMRDSLDLTLDQATHDLGLLSGLSEVRGNSPDGVRRILETLQRSYPDYAWIGIARPDGKVFASTGGLLENRDVTARPWFRLGQRTPIMEDYHPAVLLGKLLPRSADPWRFVDVAGPIRDEHGRLIGVLAIHLSWDWARALARNLLTPAIREYGAQIILVRGDGVVMLGPDAMVEQRVATDSLRLALQGKTGALTERWPDGQVYVTGYSMTGRNHARPGLQWAVLVRQTEAAALSSAHAFERRVLLLSLALALALAIGAALLARRIVRPLKTLSGAIEDIARAPGSGVPSAIPEVVSFHEGQVLSEALRHLLHNEREHHGALEQMNARLEETVAARTAELQEMLMCDVLTGLPNRRALMQRLPEAMARAARLDCACVVLFLDMDGFKLVNDTRGHEEGDELLRQFAIRLRDGIRETDMAARLAGDEFVIVLEMMPDQAEAELKAEYLLAQLSRPFELPGGPVAVAASIGLAAQLPDQPRDAIALLARADHAMYKAKRRGKGRLAVAPANETRADAA